MEALARRLGTFSVVMGLLLFASAPGAEILLSPGDIGPSSSTMMQYEERGLLLTRPEAWAYSGVAIPLPAELEGASAIDVTLYFIPDSDAPGDVDFNVLVDSYDAGDPYNVGGMVGHADPVPVGGTDNVVYSQEFNINFYQAGTDLFRIAVQRVFYGEATDTYATGVYLHALSIASGQESGVGAFPDCPKTSLVVTPNPFSHELSVHYGLSQSSDVSLMIFDAEGRLIEALDRGQQSEGTYALTWEPHGDTQGIYFVRLLLDGVDSNARVVKIR